MNLTAKQLRMASTWNRERLEAFPAIQWQMMQWQADARTRGMNICRPSAIKPTLCAMKAAFGLSTKCTWNTFLAHMELFISVTECVHIPTGERPPERMQPKGGLPPLVQEEEPEPEV
jgi:hypothetical protein